MTYSIRRPAAQVVSGSSEQKNAPPADVKFDANERAARAGLAAAAQGFGEDADGACVVRNPTTQEPNTPPASTPSTHEAPASHARHHIDRAAAIRTLLAQHRHRYRSRSQRRAQLPVPLPVQWRDLSPHQRYRRFTEAAQCAGGLALTLNLHPDIEAHTRASMDPMRYLTLRIDRALKKHGMSDLPRAFILETSREGKLHLHGVIVPGEHDLDTVKLALREGAGKITRQRAAPRQLDLQEITGAAGWASYTLKGDPASIYLAQPATRAAREHHQRYTVRLRTLRKFAKNWKQRAARWDQRPGPEPDPDMTGNPLPAQHVGALAPTPASALDALDFLDDALPVAGPHSASERPQGRWQAPRQAHAHPDERQALSGEHSAGRRALHFRPDWPRGEPP